MKQKGKMSGKKLKQMFVTYTFVLPDFIGLYYHTNHIFILYEPI